jgi:flagellum-specific ATP synthase
MFGDEGLDVLLLIDSVTRFAMAQREIGLSVGEPPTTKGYTPSVFAELPKLLERAGPGREGEHGSITALFTVLVDGDDHNEPIADAVRGILDGHIVMERAIAERGRYPAINVLKSISRLMPMCHTTEENALIARAKTALALYGEMEELIRIGAYKPGADPDVDEAVRVRPALEALLGQGRDERTGIKDSFAMLAEALT